VSILVSILGSMAPKRPASPPFGGGGLRQRLARLGDGQPRARDAAKPSALLSLLMRELAWGKMSSPLTQAICAAAEQDGLAHPDVSRVAAMGSRGLHVSNISRGLKSMWPNMALVDALSTVGVTHTFMKGMRKTTEKVCHGGATRSVLEITGPAPIVF
jgi:hypothetical protein